MKKINYICTRDGTVYDNRLNRLVRLSRFDSRVWLLFTGMRPCVSPFSHLLRRRSRYTPEQKVAVLRLKSTASKQEEEA